MKRFLLIGLILALCLLCVPALADCTGSPDLADMQDGVCAGSFEVCDVDEWVEPDYGDLLYYEDPEESCDDRDNNCDGYVDEDLTLTFYHDSDGDGYGDPADTREDCTAPSDFVADASDCDDNNPFIYPGASEWCDTQDNDCDSGTPDGSDEYNIGQPCDGDGDDDLCEEGSMVCVSANMVCDDPNDEDPEICDSLDNDCDVDIDEGLTFDADDDGYTSIGSCEGSGDDCDDDDQFINPDASDWCDTVDNDCDSGTPDGSGEFEMGNPCDGIDDDLCEEGSMVCVAAYMVCDDPNDANPDLCNGTDDDCDPATADGSAEATLGDACDGADDDLCDEGFIVCTAGALGCDDPNDADPDLCNSADDDCNAATADGSGDPQNGLDCDGADSDLCNEGTNSCVSGVISCSDSTVDNPELCNGTDDDCDPTTADGSAEATLGDACDGTDDDLCDEGFIVCTAGALGCDDPNDADPDLCNSADDDCNAATADGSAEATLGDACDGTDDDLCEEGFIVCTAGALGCDDPNDANPEICDGLDNDCDGATADGSGETAPLNDNQIGVCAGSYQDCGGVSGWQNDYSGIATYEAIEVTCDTLDNDCDGDVDQEDSDITDPSTFSSLDVNEGEDIVLSFTPLTGATYAFDCDTDNAPDYSAFGPTSSLNCPTTDNDIRNVGGKLTDEHNCVWTHTDDVTVSNLNPVIVGDATPQAQTVQYSDHIVDVMLNATDVPADLPDLTVDTSYTKDGGASVPDSLPAGLSLVSKGCDETECSWNVTGIANVPRGEYIITFTVADADGGSVTETTTITVNREDATCELEDENLVALKVASSGGKSGEFTLMVYVEEKQPDTPADMAEPGDIDNAKITMQLVPVGPGSSVSPSGPCSSIVYGSGYDGYKIFNCPFNNVEVNTYDVTVTVNGEYYNTGTCESVFVVYDPSLGFTTGGGKFLWDGDQTNFGFTMKYNKKAQNVQGSLLMIRHAEDGIYRVKSNALYGLALSPATSPYGYATFSGKSTYLEPGSENKGGMVFKVYVEDNNEPGKGADKFWIQVTGGISMPTLAKDNAVTITGGNIVVPHTPASTRK